MSEDGWTVEMRAFLALLILCEEADAEEAAEQFPRQPGQSRNIKRRAAEWLAGRLVLK